jgi:hypothetical protein
MVQLGGDLSLLLEAHQEGGIVYQVGVQHLDRHQAVQDDVFGFVDNAEAAPTKLFQYFVFAKVHGIPHKLKKPA